MQNNSRAKTIVYRCFSAAHQTAKFKDFFLGCFFGNADFLPNSHFSRAIPSPPVRLSLRNPEGLRGFEVARWTDLSSAAPVI